MKKKSCCIAAAFCLLLGGVCFAWAGDSGASEKEMKRGAYFDVPEKAWFCQAVEDMSRKGIISGYPDGSFRPEKTVTCGEFIKMAVAVSGITETVSPGEEPEHWALPAYERGIELGWYTKEDIGKGKMDRKINRGQMAFIAAGVLETFCETEGGGKGEWLQSYSKWMGEISDIDAKTQYEYEIICAYGNGILNGYPDGSFRPRGFLSRAEAAAVITRLDAAVSAGKNQKASDWETEPGGVGSGGVLQGEFPKETEIPPSAIFSDLNGDLISDLKIAWKDELWDSWTEEQSGMKNDYAAFRAGDSYQTNPAGLPKGTLVIGYSYPYEGNDWFFSNFGRGLLNKPGTKEEQDRILQVLERAEPKGADVIGERFLKFTALNYQKDESKSEDFRAGGSQAVLDIREGRITIYLWPAEN